MHNFWQGEPVVVQGEYLDKASGRMKCQEVGSSFTSFRIKRTPEGKATGYWKGITTSNKQQYKFTVGVSSSKEDTSSQESKTSLMKSLETGWSVSASLGGDIPGIGSLSGEAGYSSTSKTEESQEHVIGREIKNTASEDSSTEHTTTCGDDDVKDQMVGLYQWVITNEAGSVNAFTPHTICRTGENAFKAPDCQFWDCLNADCSKCKGDVAKVTTDTPVQVQPTR